MYELVPYGNGPLAFAAKATNLLAFVKQQQFKESILTQHRISCGVNNIDCVDASSLNAQVFWLSLNTTNNTWYLTTRFLNEDSDVTNLTPIENMLYPMGQGTYGGICAFGNSATYWTMIFSLNGQLNVVRLSGDCVTTIFATVITAGSFPQAFWCDELEMGLLYFINNGQAYACLTQNWQSYFIPKTLDLLAPFFDAYHLMGATVTLGEYIEIQRYAETNNIGRTWVI